MTRRKGKTEKFMLSLDDVTFAYRATVMELYKRGYSFNTSKRMVKESGLLDAVRKAGWLWFHDLTERDCADIVEKKLNRQNKIAVNF